MWGALQVCRRRLVVKDGSDVNYEIANAAILATLGGNAKPALSALETSGSQAARGFQLDSAAALLQTWERNNAPLRRLRCSGLGYSCPAPASA